MFRNSFTTGTKVKIITELEDNWFGAKAGLIVSYLPVGKFIKITVQYHLVRHDEMYYIDLPREAINLKEYDLRTYKLVAIKYLTKNPKKLFKVVV